MPRRPIDRQRLLASVSLVAAIACAPERGPDWPQWRGERGLGVADGTPLPTSWSSDSTNIRWRTELVGVGNSSPVVSGDRIFLTTAYRDDGSEQETGLRWRAVLGFDRQSGALLWKTPLYSVPAEQHHRLNTVSAPTPAADGKRVFVYFGPVLASLDADGEVLWQHEIDPTYAEHTRYGAASSPVLTDEAVVVVQDKEYAETEDVGWLAAFDPETGERLWRTEWSHTCCSYSTPLVARRGGEQEIIFAHSGAVVSYSASSGEQLWSHHYDILQMVSSPVLIGNELAISGGAHNVKHTVYLRLAGTGAETSVEQLWASARFAPQNSSPVLYGGRLFTVNDQGIAACYDAQTGQLLWNRRLGYARNRASLVAGDGKVYVSSTSGWISVLAASDEYELLAENTLGEPATNASPAIADGCLLLRTKQNLVCIEADVTEKSS